MNINDTMHDYDDTIHPVNSYISTYQTMTKLSNLKNTLLRTRTSLEVEHAQRTGAPAEPPLVADAVGEPVDGGQLVVAELETEGARVLSHPLR